MSDLIDEMTVTGGFAELVYADPDWLRAEFDEIMTANFKTFPVLPPRPGSAGPRRPGRRPQWVRTVGRGLAGATPTVRNRSRQRSPPLSGAPRWSAKASETR
jgi:hypothetical protein